MTRYEKNYIKAYKEFSYATIYLLSADYSAEDIYGLYDNKMINNNMLEKNFVKASSSLAYAESALIWDSNNDDADLTLLDEKAQDELHKEPAWLMANFTGDRLVNALKSL